MRWELICIGVIVGWLFYKYFIVRRWGLEESGVGGGRRRLQPPRGSSGWPVVGETIEFIASGFTSRPVSFMEKRKSIYGKVFRTHILGRPIIVSTDPDVNKVVLQNQGNVFIPSYPKSVIELLGESSILQINGGIQKRLHAIIGGFLRSPQFKARITKDIENSVKLTLSSWMDRKNPYLPLYLQDETKKITFSILVRLLMSVEPGEDMEFLKIEFREVIKGLICLPIKLPGFRMYKSLQAKERMLKMVRKIVDDRKSAMEKNESKGSGLPNDVIDVLLRDTGESDGSQQRLPLHFISGNIIEMMIPGEDSVPMIMTLAVKYLSDNPAALACLVDENNKLKKRKDESCEEYDWTDYVSLQFTQGGPNYLNISKSGSPALASAMCSLVASIQRCSGLWRLHEILGHYKWPEHWETDFTFGSSSVGAVNAPFLAAFSAATGKRSSQFTESEESDPDWGCWSASQELRNPSIKVIFPTIERVKAATCGIFASKYILCFSQKTWLRLKHLSILHDAVPRSAGRVGHPMHVKVARRRFQSRTNSSSFGWVYCGSHNFSAAAWGRPLHNSLNSQANSVARSKSVLGSRLHICNYEFGIVFIVPPSERTYYNDNIHSDLDDIILPFVVPAPRYRSTDIPATKFAMSRAYAELAYQEREKRVEVMDDEEELMDEEEELLEVPDAVVEEKEDEKAYAEKLWGSS